MLNNKQILAINLLVYEGMLKKDVAKAIDVVPETISAWFRSQEFSSEYDIAMRKRIQEIAAKANQVIFELMSGAQSETVRLSAAKEYVSRAGYDAPIKQEITQKTITVGLDEEDDGNQHQAEEESIQQDISAPTSELQE